MSKVQKQRVQTFGRKKTATAVAVCQQGKIRKLFSSIIKKLFLI
jgi:ribosomal protein S9